MKKKKFNCPAELALSLIGGKWKAILLYNLRQRPRRFGELKRLSPGISSATLATQLRQLEQSGLVKRNALSPLPKLAVEYALTERGDSLKPALYSLIRWGIANQRDFVIGEFRMASFARQ